MGAEHSRIVAKSPLSWRTLQYGIHYAATDVAVWPHLSPLAQWFTARDALALKTKLKQRTSTNLLSFDEFVAWLQNGKAPRVLHKAAMPEHCDIMTPPNPTGAAGTPSPPPSASKLRGVKDKDPMATRVLELHLEHVFHSLKGGNGSKLYAMEFLAAFVLVSRAIWSVDEKVRVLMELFHDPALSARHAATSLSSNSFGSKHEAPGSYEKCFRETDLAQLFLCIMRGVAKVTVGIGRVWDYHGLSIATLARQFAATAMNDALNARKICAQQVAAVASEAPSRLAKAATSPKRSAGGGGDPRFVPGGISEPEFLEFVVGKPVIQRFLALFVAEELRNPFTFSPLSSLCTGMALPESYRSVVDQQTKLYHSLLQNYVTFEGRDAKRVLSAATLIQSTWRRRRSRTLLEQHKKERIRQRHASAATLQSYLRQFQFAKVLEQHADAEREAFNGGLFVTGSGACIPTPKASVSSKCKPSSTREHPGLTVLTSPLKLIETFKLRNVRICFVAASQTCALALADDRKTLFAWGRCLPCVYQNSGGVWGSQEELDTDGDSSSTARLFQMTPTRLAHRFSDDEQVVQLACGLRHALVLTDGGMVFSWGFNDHGQLGHGSAETLEARTGGKVSYAMHFTEHDGRESEFLASPTRLLYFQGSAAQHADPIPIQHICCGDYYSMALSREGDVFTWGEASEGQLGHGDAHPAFQVAFVDLHMLNSAYTFLPQPEPVLALSDVEIVQIGCRKNHSVALTRDGRVFEWGNWGKRCGRDMEHAFVPIEKKHITDLRLRQLSVGDHHIVAEGSSVWMNLVAPVASSVSLSTAGQPETEDSGGDTSLQQQQQPEDGFGVAKSGFYLACAAYSCSFDAIETYFAGKDRSWTCTIVEFDVDDLEDEPVAVDADRPGEVDDQQGSVPTPQGQQQFNVSGVQSVWTKRVQQYALSVEQVGRFDARIQQLRPLSYRHNVGYSYEKLLNTWLFGHVEDRFVVFPRGKPAGFYVQFLLPLESISPSETEQRVETELAEGYVAPAVVEFRVCGSNTAAKTINKRGFAVHAFHPGMEDAKLTRIQRMKKKKASVVTDENSLFLLEFNESCLPSTASLKGGHSNVDRSDGDVDDNEMDLSALIVSEMHERVLTAQESGVLAVLIVLDLLDVEPFELHFDDDSGVYVPVLMINKYALAVQDSWTLKPSHKCLAFHEVVELMVAPLDDSEFPATHRSAMASPRFVSRPMWTTRCFRRVDTLSGRVQCALDNGAAGVILVQDPESLEMDGETRGAPIFHHSLSVGRTDEKRLTDKLVAMISHEEGARLRASSHMSLCQKYMPLLSKEGSNYELLAQTSFEIRPGGTTYAWGNGQNGRLGVGPSASDVFEDGYEALTDTAYRFVDQPTPIVTLAGIEMRQLACGTTHSLAVSRQGKVLTWGRGSRGALAQVSSSTSTSRTKKRHKQSARDVWVPKQVHGLRFENIVQVAANDACSLFLTEIVSPELYRERRREIAQLKAVARKSLL
ncbi:hypothetical protein Gpo141_00009978 [Globisporangium polare]